MIRLVLIIGIVLLTGLGILDNYSLLDADRGSCQSFCSEAGTEFHSISSGQCICEQTQSSLDIQGNRLITWSTLVNVGSIKDFSVEEPIPQNVIDQVNAQLLAQQQAAQGQ